MKLLFFGDVIGRTGREGLYTVLPDLIREHQADFVIVNAENASHGKGLTPKIADEMWELGVHVLTMGNHTFDRKEIGAIINDPRVLRPANYPPAVSGHGSGVFKTRSGIPIGVMQVMGRVYMPIIDCPFRTADREIERLKKEATVIFVDIHADNQLSFGTISSLII